MKLLSGFILTILMLFSAQLRAGSVQVGQWFPWTFVNQEINQIPVSLNYQRAITELNYASLQPILKNVQIQLDGQFVNNQFSESGVQNLFQAQTSVQIEEIYVDQLVRREIAGNVLNIRMKATCYGFKVDVPAFQVQLDSSFRPESNYWIPQLNHVNIEIPLSSWTQGNIQCVGPNGIDQYLTQLVDDQLRNPVFIEKVLKDWMSEQIQNKWVTLWKNLLVATENNFFDVKMNPPQKEGLSVYGSIPTNTDKEIRLPTHIQMHAVSMSDQPAVILTNEVFTELVKDQISKILTTRQNLQEVKAFRKLMRSRLMQFFVWPDLMKFEKNAPFYLTARLPKNSSQKLEQEFLKMEKSKTGDDYEVQMQFLGYIQSERDTQSVNYIDWSVGLLTKLKPEITNSSLKLSLSETKSQINFKMNDLYVQKFQPNQRVPKKTILKSIEAVLQTPQVNYALPQFQWKNKVWKMNGLHDLNGILVVPWIVSN